MSLATSLLQSLAAAQVDETDTTLYIDVRQRTINIPKSITNLGVESDDEVLRLNFKMSRYLEDVDLSAFSIRINYLNAQGDDDVYKVTDATTIGDYITFSWLVGPTATAYKGNTKFNVCMMIVDSEYVIQQEFNTTVATLPVLEGLECDERVVSEYTDILEQWENRLFGVVDTEQANLVETSEAEQEKIAQKGVEVLASIPEDYTEVYELAHNSVRTRANAIVSTVEDFVVNLDDASDDYLRGLTIRGRSTQASTTGAQLVDFTAGTCVTGVSKDFSNDVLTIYGDGSLYYQNWQYKVLDVVVNNPGKTLYFDYESISFASAPDGTMVQLNLAYSDGTNEYIAFYHKNGSRYTYSIPSDTSTITAANLCVYATNNASAASSNTVKIVKPMLQFGTDALDYETYSGGVASPSPEWPQAITSIESPTVRVYGGNLLDLVDMESTEINGITWTYSNGTVIANGTATAQSYTPTSACRVYLLPGTYYLSGGVDVVRAYILRSRNGIKTYIKAAAGETSAFDVQANDAIYFYTQIPNGGVANNVVAYPMIIAGDSTAEWENYKEYQDIVPGYTLRGIPVDSDGNYTDANGRQWICDEVDFERGVYIQRIGVKTFDGSETWGISEQNTDDGYLGVFHTAVDGIVASTTAICSHYVQSDNVGLIGKTGRFDTYYGQLRINIDTLTTVNEWIIQLNAWNEADTPLTLVHILTTPVETELTSTEIEAFKWCHTNYHNTTVMNDAGAHMAVKYNADTLIFLRDNQPRPTDEQVQAAVDAWLTNYYSSAEGVSF